MKFYTTSKISENIHETPEGYLLCVGVSIARTGGMIYGPGGTPLELGPDGRVIVSRDAAEVFRAETIASFEGKPITIGHPVDFVDPSNWKELTKGLLTNVRRGTGEQESDLVSDLLLTDKRAIELVKGGLREVSCGYENEYTQTGVGRGIQTNIVGNHCALVEEGRAGASYAINDHKGKESAMKLQERIKAIFGKAQDEALKTIDEGNETPADKTPASKEGFVSYDDFKKAMDKIDAFMGKGGDASTQPTQSEPAKVVAKDEEGEESEEAKKKKKAQDARDKWIDAQMAKDAAACDNKEDGDDDESEDDNSEGSEEDLSEDDDFEESTMTGDSASEVAFVSRFSPPDLMQRRKT